MRLARRCCRCECFVDGMCHYSPQSIPKDADDFCVQGFIQAAPSDYVLDTDIDLFMVSPDTRSVLKRRGFRKLRDVWFSRPEDITSYKKIDHVAGDDIRLAFLKMGYEW